MSDEIGKAAGTIWKYLEKNGEVSTYKLIKETKIKQRLADRAIGWLAREGKVKLSQESKREIISLL